MMNQQKCKNLAMKLFQMLTNRYLFSVIYLAAALLSFIPVLMKPADPLQKLCFLWGIALLGWDFFTKRIMFSGQKAVWLVLLVFSYGISVLLNLGVLYEGVKHLVYSCILLFIYYPFEVKGDLQRQKRMLLIFNDLFVMLTFVASVISLGQYLLQKSYLYTVDGLAYGQGVRYNRLYGIYISSNPGGLLSICAIFQTFITFWLDKNHFAKYKKYYLTNVVIQFVYYTLTLSNGAKLAWIVGFAVFSLVFAFPYFKTHFRKGTVISLILAAAVFLGCYFGFEIASNVSRKVVLSTTKTVQRILKDQDTVKPGKPENPNDPEATEEPTEDVEIVLERVEGDDAEANNGRFDIWKAGFKALKQRPLFGWADGQFYRNGEKVMPLDESKLTDVNLRWLRHARGNMHNAVVQILVYSGFVGTLIFAIFAVLAGIQYIRNLLKLFGRGDYYLLASIFIFLVMLVSQMVSEAHILYSHADPFACVFWAYLGFGLSYAKAEKQRLAEDHAFVCDTPLQVLNAVSMVLSDADGSAENSDLFVYHQFKNSHEIADRVRKTGVFRNVYDFEPFPAKAGILSKITTFVRILNPRRALARRFQGGKRIYEKQDYGTLALSFFTPFSDVVHLALDAPRTIQFEDGTASYITENLETRYRSRIFEAYNRFIACGKLSYYPERMYLSNPDFCLLDTLPLEAVHGISKNERIQRIAKEIFGYSKSVYLNNSVVYLTQPVGPAEGGEAVVAKEREYLPLIRKLDPIARIHPRQTEEAFTGFSIDRVGNMWELECAECIGDSNVLIGAFSTAQLIPKMLFDREPTLIFLYQLYGSRFDQADKLVERMKASYRNPEKVHVPQTRQELEAILRAL